ncbi:MAG: hypothetical protein INQ03_22195 [Candidatus Heimdallarchaeota archaeon]|nr:hypothetical protein [Candidatus Heimdallarchaeota archaeon]
MSSRKIINEDDTRLYVFKLVIIPNDSGELQAECAKSWEAQGFLESHMSTLGADFLMKRIQGNGVVTELQIWFISNKEEFRSLVFSKIHNAYAVFIVKKEQILDEDNLLKLSSNNEHLFLLGYYSDLEKQMIRSEVNVNIKFMRLEDIKNQETLNEISRNYITTLNNDLKDE